MTSKSLGALVVLVASLTGMGASDAPSLPEAAKSGDLTTVRALLQRHVGVNTPDAEGMSALHWAVLRNEPLVIGLLLNNGANVRAVTRHGVTPLTLAATNGATAVVEQLLKAGADANSALPQGETVVMTAARAGATSAVRLLMARGADVNRQERWNHQTALMWAAAEGHAETVRALVEGGADLNARTIGGFSPFMFAVRQGHLEVVRTLLDAGASPNDRTLASSLPFRLTGPVGNDGSSALGMAIVNGHYEVAALLLEHGADPNAADPRGSALHALAWMRRPGVVHPDFGGYQKPPETGLLDSLALATLLLQKGADPNARITWQERHSTYDRPEVAGPPNIPVGRSTLSYVGATPFYLAAQRSDVALMRLLAASGADPTLGTSQGVTPLMAAAGLGYWEGETPDASLGVPEHETLEAVALAIELGNDVNAVAPFSPVTLEGGGQFLLTGLPSNINDLAPPAALGDMRWAGSTALHGAALRGSVAIVDYLAAHGAKLDAKNRLGWTALSVAEGVFVNNTFVDRPEAAVRLRDLMTANGFNPDESMICSVCSTRGSARLRANKK